ncbi:C-X-C motif chemokine 3-like [Anguilla rostrata]|uniref:C-X-C motif chemokine 3-like n=1 Tax=Anguilla rostrata TaxID=7938 RepID=UPI0030D590DE
MLSCKTCAVLSSLLLWVAWSGGDVMTQRIGLRARCECVDQVDRVGLRRIVEIAVQEPNAFCSKTEIILTLKQNVEVCLNPDSEQGRNIQECWRSHDMDPAKIKPCLRRKTTTP